MVFRKQQENFNEGVYGVFFEHEGHQWVKIGFAKTNASRRARQIELQIRKPTRVVHWKFADKYDAHNVERFLHYRFRINRVKDKFKFEGGTEIFKSVSESDIDSALSKAYIENIPISICVNDWKDNGIMKKVAANPQEIIDVHIQIESPWLSVGRELPNQQLPDWMDKLENVEEMKIDLNRPLKGSLDFLSKLPKLWKLELSGFHIIIPDCIGELHNLRELKVRNTDIEKLPESFRGLKSLRVLELYDNSNITTLPESLGDLKNLKYLKVHGGRLTTLPESVGSLASLLWLDIYNTKLKKLPKSIGNLRKLEFLFIENNQLSSIPFSVGGLQNLSSIYMCGNKFKRTPRSLKSLKKMKYLDMRNNPLSNEEKRYIARELRNGTYYCDCER